MKTTYIVNDLRGTFHVGEEGARCTSDIIAIGQNVGADEEHCRNIAETVALMLNRELRLAWPLVIERYYADYGFGCEQSTPSYYERLFFATEAARDQAIEDGRPFAMKIQDALGQEVSFGITNGPPCLVEPTTTIQTTPWQNEWLKGMVEGDGDWEETLATIEA